MSKISFGPGAMLAPVPAVLVSSGSVEKPNVCTVAWTGIINTKPSQTYISLRKSRYSHSIISKTGEFVINLTPSSMVRICDRCGVYSGRNRDKFADCSLTAEPSQTVEAPSIAESPVSIECRVRSCIELGSHDMFIADVTAVRIDEKIVDPSGRICLEKAGLCAYVHGEYYSLGKKIGSFGFSVKKKQKKHLPSETGRKAKVKKPQNERQNKS